jgi:hypothetical protein
MKKTEVKYLVQVYFNPFPMVYGGLAVKKPFRPRAPQSKGTWFVTMSGIISSWFLGDLTLIPVAI